MENTPEENKEVTEVVKKSFEPWLGLRDALDELKIDYKSPDFTEEAMM